MTAPPDATRPFAPFAGERVLVVGLGRAGLPAALRLELWGADVAVWDDGAEARAAAEGQGLAVADPAAGGGRFRWDALLLSPGIPHRLPRAHPAAEAASAAGVPILCDVEWLFRAVRAAGSGARFVGITGTNGKSTTTALLHHLLRAAGRESAAGGNLGPAALSLELLGDGGTYALEMSSYMLERTMLVRFDTALMLNLSPDHLDRHGDMDGYAAAKARVFARQRPDDLAVLGMDDEGARAMRGAVVGRFRPVSGMAPQPGGVWAENGTLRDDDGPILDLAGAPALPGSHNAQNAAAAAACALDLGLTRAQVAAGLASFPGLPHRQETVAEIAGVSFVNDSKATNADSAARALSSYGRVVWIAGGMAKEGGIEGLTPLFPRIARAFLIGRDAPLLAATLAAHGVPHEVAGTLEAAVPAAAQAARAGAAPVVLLSPACASWDQFTGFDARGDRFRALVGQLGSGEGRRGMMSVSRADTSVLGRWWWTVDRWTLAALLALIGFGYVMMLAASPAVAERVIGSAARGLLLAKQVVFLGLAAALMVAVSLLSPRAVRRVAAVGCIGALALTAATLVIGFETKGARRWLNLPLLGTMQPSEFLKPCLAVVAAAMLARGKAAAAERMAEARQGLGLLHPQFFWPAAALALIGLVALLLKSQPDIGMLMVVLSVFLAQFFVSGLNVLLVGMVGAAVAAGGVGAYFVLPHVRSRVDRFLDPSSGDTFQITKAMEAFGHGGLLGRGPGEGRVKNALPDAHADFVFAVAGEEFGFVVCLVILSLFAFVVVRGLVRLVAESDMFVVLAATGLLAQFGLQAFVNMASSLHLIPTKGMTLPFVSYGGSSVLAIAFGMGMLLALTRRGGPRLERGVP